MRTKNDFLKEFGDLTKAIRRLKDPSYGAPVMPFLELYGTLTSYEERRAYQEALEDMLSSMEAEQRRLAVTICTGFLVFRDVIGK